MCQQQKKKTASVSIYNEIYLFQKEQNFYACVLTLYFKCLCIVSRKFV